jgi:hypothetical protein
MKKNQTLLLLLVLNIATASAYPKKHKTALQQEDRKWSIGIIGGPQYSRAYNFNDSTLTGGNTSQGERIYISGFVGLNSHFYFKRFFFIEANLFYSNQGEIYKPSRYIDASAFSYVTNTKTFHYLKIPLTVGINLPFQFVSFKFSFGVHMNALLAYKEKFDYYNRFYNLFSEKYILIRQGSTDISYRSTNNNGNEPPDPMSQPAVGTSTFNPWPFKRITWGIDYSIALDIRLSERWELNIAARGDYEFIDSENKKCIISYSGYSGNLYPPYRHATHNLTASFGVGVSYLFLR